MELKPCPFCGEELKIIIIKSSEWKPTYEIEHVDYMKAYKVGCPLAVKYYHSMDSVVAAVNMRGNKNTVSKEER